MLLLPLCVLAVTCWTGAALADDERNSGVPKFTEQMINCHKQRKVYWREQGTCHTLPDNVCGSNQWLVLDADRINTPDQFEPRCKVNPCARLSLHVFWPAAQSCQPKYKIKKQCPEGNAISNDLYGDGICECIKAPAVHLALNLTDAPSKCYKLYTRGPCPEGQSLQAQHIKDTGRVAVCKPSNCSSSTHAVVWHGPNQRCYRLETIGPCQKGEVFQVSPLSYLPECVGTNDLTVFDKLHRCPMYEDGTCKPEVIIQAENAVDQMQDIESAVKRKRQRKRSAPGKSR